MIPVYVNVFNRLTTTRRLCEQIACLPDAVPIIIDNASTWQPLLDWYRKCPFEVIRLTTNVGHHAPWVTGVVNRKCPGFYCVTDCDLDIGDCPADLIEHLKIPFGWDNSIVKSGLGLRIDDLPPWQSSVTEWESRWWETPADDARFFHAAVDTTFAMYRAETPHSKAQKVIGIKSTRTAPPYLARHVPWYLDAENLDEENRNYFETANKSNSWKPQGKGLIANYAIVRS
jgi:hypothetical protein